VIEDIYGDKYINECINRRDIGGLLPHDESYDGIDHSRIDIIMVTEDNRFEMARL
jgi:hypothetical protein